MKIFDTKFHQNPFSGSVFAECGQRDMGKHKFFFCYFSSRTIEKRIHTHTLPREMYFITVVYESNVF